MFHIGHVNLFRAAKERFGYVVASLNTDAFVHRYKGRYPIMPLNQRMAIVSACRYVDQVMINTGDEDSKPAILLSGATHIVHGSDWVGNSLINQMGLSKKWLSEHGIELVYFPYTLGINSKLIRRRLRCNRRLTSAFPSQDLTT